MTAPSDRLTRAVLLLGAVAILVPFVIAFLAPTIDAGIAVSFRFLERPGGIPAETTASAVAISATSLREWATSADNIEHLNIYAFRVLPLDLIYIIGLGGYLAFATRILSNHMLAPGNLLRAVPSKGWLIAPGLYIITDLIEDGLIFLFLTKPDAISDASVTALAVFRSIKILANTVAMLQVLTLGLLGTIPGRSKSAL